MEMKRYICDALIIGGGAAGCYAAISLSRLNPDMNILLVDKAPIERSGCLAAGVNALNAYITKGQTPQNYVDYAIKDGHGIVRPDLLLTMSERLNHVTQDMEQLGLVILKDEYGDYVMPTINSIEDLIALSDDWGIGTSTTSIQSLLLKI